MENRKNNRITYSARRKALYCQIQKKKKKKKKKKKLYIAIGYNKIIQKKY